MSIRDPITGQYLLTVERLKNLLHYDPETGLFRWRYTRRHIKKDVVAGSLDNGYVCIRLDNRPYLAHRLAFLYMTDAWPKDHVDHIDGNRSNNRFTNLRLATRGENRQNLKGSTKSNASGFLGVCINVKRRRWIGRIEVNHRAFYLGTFHTPEEAYESYLKAKALLHPFQTIAEILQPAPQQPK